MAECTSPSGRKEFVMKTEVTRIAKIWQGEEGIVRGVGSLNSIEATITDAMEICSAIFKVSEGKKRPLLVDIKNVKSATRETREYFAGDEAARIIEAMALLIGSPVGRMIGNFFLRINKPIYPTKLFTSENEAIEWLKGLKE